MSNLIAIDIGNTNITVGLFKGRKLLKKAKIPTNAHSLYIRRIRPFIKEVDEVVVSSVVPLATARLIAELHKITKANITILGKDLNVPIRNMYRIKNEVGQDRLVNAYAAKVLYGA